MFSQKTHQQIYFWVLTYLCFSVPFMSKWLPFTIGVVALALNFLLEGNLLSKLKKASAEPWALLLILFYGLHLVSVTYSTNISEANRDIFLKLPLLILPLSLHSVSISKEQKNRLFITWILATCAAAIIILIQAYFNVQSTGLSKYWFYSDLAGGKHPAYFSMYCVTAIVLLFQDKFEKWKALPLVLLPPMVFLLSSRMQIVVLLILGGIFFIQQLFRRKKTGITMALLFFAFLFTTSMFEGEFLKNTRISKLLVDVNSLFSSENKSIRVMIWQSSIDVLDENWVLGFGSGAENENLNKFLQEKVTLSNKQEAEEVERLTKNESFMERIKLQSARKNIELSQAIETYVLWSLRKNSTNSYDKFYKHHYNYHNQFLQSWATAGILCLLTLFAIFFIAVKKGIQYKNLTLLAIAFLIAMSFMSESMLERQYGVIYFSLMLPLILLDARKSA